MSTFKLYQQIHEKTFSSPPRAGHDRAPAHSSSSPFITPRRSGSSASIKTDIMSAEASKASPRKEGIKRSLTMSASAATFAPLLDQMNQKFSRSITDLPVASDIPRMAPRTSVIDVQTDSLIFNRNEGTVGLPKPINAIDLSKSLLVLLFAVFSPDNKRMATIAGEKYAFHLFMQKENVSNKSPRFSLSSPSLLLIHPPLSILYYKSNTFSSHFQVR